VDGEGAGGGDEEGGGKRRKRNIFLAISAVAALVILVAAGAVILPFLLAILVAYVLFPSVCWVERKVRLPRWVCILLVYALMLGTMAGFGAIVVPRLFDETKKLRAEMPRLAQQARESWLPAIDERLQKWTGGGAPEEGGAPSGSSRPAGDASAGVPANPRAPIVIRPREDGAFDVELDRDIEVRKRDDDSWVVGPREPRGGRFSSERAIRDAFDGALAFAQRNSLELLRIGRVIVAGVSRGIFYFFLTLMLAGYMMHTYERIHGFFRELWAEENRRSLDRFLQRVDRGLAGVVRGQLLICLVNGVLSAIGFWIFDLKYWPILSLIAAAMSIIPIFGSILSSIPAVAIGLTQGFGTALGVLVWIIAIHQLEANFLNPKIIGDAAKIHPVLVVFALLFGEHYFQITGALLAVPCLALVQAVFLHFRESVLGVPQRSSRSSLADTPAPAGFGHGHGSGPSSDAATPLAATKRSIAPTQIKTSGGATPSPPPSSVEVGAEELAEAVVEAPPAARPTDPPTEREQPSDAPPAPNAPSAPRKRSAVSTTLKSHTE
jgi:predicted PurR-regulated permease PerM